MDLLGRELARSQREGISTIMRLGDVDHFKTVNDTHGHLVGDEVLCEIARRLLSYIRSYDFVGRYGGEEFLIVLNNCNPAFAESREQEIRPGIPSRPVAAAAGPLKISMSFGLLVSGQWGVRPVGELLQENDAALYAATAGGRNCVRTAKSGAPESKPASGVHEPAHPGSLITQSLFSARLATSCCASPRWSRERASPAMLPGACRYPRCSKTSEGS
jgi:diguanylate cyclase (GGDEF)-like protein